MSVKREPSGRRSIRVEVEVPGTPEQVWEAIATGPGGSSWFVPTEILVSGGPTKSDLWMQMHADVSNVPITLTKVTEGPVLGSAIQLGERPPPLELAGMALIGAALGLLAWLGLRSARR